MISLIGFSGLIFSLLCSIIIIFIFFLQTKKYSETIFYYALYGSVISILISFLALMFSYISSDFSNYNVFQNSHSSKPLLYRITGTWGNHEGSMLLWLLIMIFYNFFFRSTKIWIMI